MFGSQKRTYREQLRGIFYRIRVHPWYMRIMALPFFLRLAIAIFLFLFGIVGLLTPIPAGWLMILSACVLVFGIRVVRRHSIRLFFFLRLHRVIEWVRYKWKK